MRCGGAVGRLTGRRAALFGSLVVVCGAALLGCSARLPAPAAATKPSGAVTAAPSATAALHRASGEPGEPPLEKLPAPPIPRPSLDAPTFVTSTRYVEDLLRFGGSLWVATRGGLERYTLDGLGNQWTYTTRDGLDSVRVLALGVENGRLIAHTEHGRCALAGASFTCEPASAPLPKTISSERFAGARVTRRLDAGDVEIVGTAGSGVWVAPVNRGMPTKSARRLTRDAQLADGFVTALAEHDGKLYVGTFNGGLAMTETSPESTAFETAPFVALRGPRRINALASTPHGLFVAASEGLFVLRSNAELERVPAVTAQGANGLAFDGRNLFVTTPGALFRLTLTGAAAPRAWWKPGGSRALQDVALAGATVWLATEDRGAVRFDGQSFSSYDALRGLPASWVVKLGARADGSVLVGTLRDGVLVLRADGSYAPLPGVPSPWTLTVHTEESGAWIGTQAGVLWTNGKGSVMELAPLPDMRVHCVLPLRGRVLAGTELGLAVFQRSAGE